ncbi:hypothetical protein LSH36_434g00053 [Paralvinella palmiformis]|uniref:RWD domain-containing protein n=1 Tax=Paralvinella palmiformis TaxID=53620 RepID=A0AAD9MZW1_9ANNE|nr:hypothetical protein LSH36_434g00053 [Paralvinella palmiformis]
MTDYKEEQGHEIEALESIYPDELQIVSTTPFPCLRMAVTSQCSDDIENATCILQFTYTERYPDELPLIEILSYENIEEEDSQTLSNKMKEEAEDNLGMAMIFTLVSAAQEKLTQIVEEAAHAVEEEREKREREKEEAETNAFDAELAEMKKVKGKVIIESTKPTGRELFMRDHTLDDSDVKFLEEDGGTAVTVDESLFQELDDLDLEEDPDTEGATLES